MDCELCKKLTTECKKIYPNRFAVCEYCYEASKEHVVYLDLSDTPEIDIVDYYHYEAKIFRNIFEELLITYKRKND
jgi:hypothetical protein